MYSPLYDQYAEPRAQRAAPRSYIPEAPSRAYTPLATPSPAATPSRGAAPSKKAFLPKEKKDEKKKDEDKEDKTGIPKEYRERVAAMEKKQQEEIDRFTNGITDMIDSVAKGLAQAAPLKVLQKHLTDATPVDIELVTEIIPDTQRELSMRKGIQGKMTELRGKIKTAKGRKTAQAKLKKQYDKHKKTFEDIEKQITAVEQKLDTLKESIPTEKLYAYFGMKAELPAATEAPEVELSYDDAEKKLEEIAKTAKSEKEGIDKAVEYLESSFTEAQEEANIQKELAQEATGPLLEIERKVPSPTSLFELRNSLRELKKSIDEFDKAPAKKVAKK